MIKNNINEFTLKNSNKQKESKHKHHSSRQNKQGSKGKESKNLYPNDKENHISNNDTHAQKHEHSNHKNTEVYDLNQY